MAYVPQLTARQSGAMNTRPQAINMGATTQPTPYTQQYGMGSSNVPLQLRQQYSNVNQPVIRPVAPVAPQPQQLTPQQQQINNMMKNLIGQGMSVQQATQQAQKLALQNPGVTVQPMTNANRVGYGTPSPIPVSQALPLKTNPSMFNPVNFNTMNLGRVVRASPF